LRALYHPSAACFGEIEMSHLINRLRRDEDGAALVEYGILVGLIAVVCIVAVTALGTQISQIFSSIASSLAAI
jgi:pilus assembly protein Flp/PilA